MTPHDSTRCACGHRKGEHVTHFGMLRCVECECREFTALPTEGVGAVDFAAADWIAGEWKDIDKYMPETANLARAYLALREQVATLTVERDDWRNDALACNRERSQQDRDLAALRAPRTDAGAVRETLAETLDYAPSSQLACLALAVGAGQTLDLNKIVDALLAALVPSGVTEAMIQAASRVMYPIEDQSLTRQLERREHLRKTLEAALAARSED